jgi:ribosomal protein L16 Arg81 hydroxylase
MHYILASLHSRQNDSELIILEENEDVLSSLLKERSEEKIKFFKSDIPKDPLPIVRHIELVCDLARKAAK